MKIGQHYKDETYRIYIAEALKILTANTAKYSGGEYMKISYKDLVNPKKEDNRSAEEIISTIKNKLGGERP